MVEVVESEATPPTADPPVRLAIPLLAWGLSLLPGLATGALARSLGEAPRLALALLPWIALIGLPGLAREAGRRREWLFALALALPPLALAAWLDDRAGRDGSVTMALAASGLGFFALLGEAAFHARGKARAIHALAWLAIVPGSAALAAALSWAVTGEAADSGPAAFFASIGPLGSLWGNLDATELDFAAAVLCPATLACAVLWSVTLLAGRRTEGAR